MSEQMSGFGWSKRYKKGDYITQRLLADTLIHTCHCNIKHYVWQKFRRTSSFMLSWHIPGAVNQFNTVLFRHIQWRPCVESWKADSPSYTLMVVLLLCCARHHTCCYCLAHSSHDCRQTLQSGLTPGGLRANYSRLGWLYGHADLWLYGSS